MKKLPDFSESKIFKDLFRKMDTKYSKKINEISWDNLSIEKQILLKGEAEIISSKDFIKFLDIDGVFRINGKPVLTSGYDTNGEIMHQTLIICSALLALLVFGLGFNVSLTRNRLKDGHSGGTDPTSPLMKAVRAHANATEYVSIIIALFVVTALVYQNRDLGLTMTILVMRR